MATIDAAAGKVFEVDTLLRGAPGVRAMLANRSLVASIENLVGGLSAQLEQLEQLLDSGDPSIVDGGSLETTNAAVVGLKDALWAVQRSPAHGAGGRRACRARCGIAAIESYLSIQQALSALDRLEVRGRDSAGLNVLVRNHGLDLSSPALRAVLSERSGDPLFGARSVHTPKGI